MDETYSILIQSLTTHFINYYLDGPNIPKLFRASINYKVKWYDGNFKREGLIYLFIFFMHYYKVFMILYMIFYAIYIYIYVCACVCVQKIWISSCIGRNLICTGTISSWNEWWIILTGLNNKLFLGAQFWAWTNYI